MSAREITGLRKRAEAIGCCVRVFRRKDYRFRRTGQEKRARYSLVIGPGYECWASSLAEMKRELEHRERIFAKVGRPTYGTFSALSA